MKVNVFETGGSGGVGPVFMKQFLFLTDLPVMYRGRGVKALETVLKSGCICSLINSNNL